MLPGLGLICAAVLFPRETVAFLRAAKRASQAHGPTEGGNLVPVPVTTGVSYLPPGVR